MNTDKISPEMREAVLKTLYHHPQSGPVIVQMLTGEVFETPPPQPSEEEKKMAYETVESLIAIHYDSFRQACIEVLGEDPETDWT